MSETLTQAGKPVFSNSELPLDVRTLTPATINQVVQLMHPTTEVTQVDVLSRANCGDGIASTADRINVRLHYASNPDRLPETMILKTLLLNPWFRLGLPAILSLSTAVKWLERLPLMGDAASKLLFVIVGIYQKYFPQAPDAMYDIESNFYRLIRPQLTLEAPEVYGALYDPRTRQFAVLMEDLTIKGARFPNALESLPLATVQSTLDTMARMHAVYWNDPQLGTHLNWVPNRMQGGMFPVFDGIGFDLIRYQVDHHPFKQDIIAPLNKSVRQLWQSMWRSQHLLQQGPQTLLHGDTHVGNTYVLPNGEGGLLDFQLLVKGNPIIDVNYYLTTALSTEQRRDHEKALINAYLQRLHSLGVRSVPDFDAAWRDYRLASLWGLVIGWLITPPVNYGEAITAANLKRLTAGVADLKPFELI